MPIATEHWAFCTRCDPFDYFELSEPRRFPTKHRHNRDRETEDVSSKNKQLLIFGQGYSYNLVFCRNVYSVMLCRIVRLVLKATNVTEKLCF
jgi:hypothetical protein